MSSDWDNFTGALKVHTDAKIHEDSLLTFPGGFSILAISGDDRHAFLHSQLINDLNEIEDTGAQYSAWCNPKGQVIVNFLVVNTGTSYLLLFANDLTDYVTKRLSMFILRADVKIENITADTPLVGLANYKLDGCNESGEVTANDGVISINLPDTSSRYFMLGNTETLISKISVLVSTVKVTPASTWALLDIYAGIPWISSNTQEKFLPQMLNLDALHALSYQKGCYPGQEVIARLHYRGEVKRRLQLIKANSETTTGQLIKTATDNNAGFVVNASSEPEGSNVGLAVIDLDKLDNPLYLDTDQENAIRRLSLPYACD